VSAVIRLDIVLREAVETPYCDLVTRPTGAAVRQRVLTALRGTPGGEALLDFSGVGLVDFSCADEVVAKLLPEALAMPVTRVVLRGVHEHHADAIEHALTRHGLVVVALLTDSPRPRLLGAVSDDWRDVFGALDRIGRSPALRVAEALAWPVTRAADALAGLVCRRCVLAHPDATFELGAVA
jgi:hypothetical protein